MTSVNKMMSDDSYINMREMLKDCISDVEERAINTGVAEGLAWEKKNSCCQ